MNTQGLQLAQSCMIQCNILPLPHLTPLLESTRSASPSQLTTPTANPASRPSSPPFNPSATPSSPVSKPPQNTTARNNSSKNTAARPPARSKSPLNHNVNRPPTNKLHEIPEVPPEPHPSSLHRPPTSPAARLSQRPTLHTAPPRKHRALPHPSLPQPPLLHGHMKMTLVLSPLTTPPPSRPTRFRPNHRLLPLTPTPTLAAGNGTTVS